MPRNSHRTANKLFLHCPKWRVLSCYCSLSLLTVSSTLSAKITSVCFLTHSVHLLIRNFLQKISFLRVFLGFLVWLELAHLVPVFVCRSFFLVWLLGVEGKQLGLKVTSKSGVFSV